MLTNGFTCGLSDVVTLDTAFTDFDNPTKIVISTYIIISTAGSEGSVVYKDPAGVVRYWPYAFFGYNMIACSQILAQATINGVFRQTTATGLSWAGSVCA